VARRIILLERADDAGQIGLHIILWADVPVARQPRYANATATTAVTDATAAELLAIQTGAIAEESRIAHWPAGTAVATILAQIVTGWNAYQARITTINPWSNYLSSWDSATQTWTQKSVA